MIKLPLLIALLAAIGMIAIACGGSDDSSTITATPATTGTTAASATQSAERGYFTNIAAIFLTGQNGSAAANDTLKTTLAASQTVDEKKAAISTFLGTMSNVFNGAITDMGSLDPPAAARASHDQFTQDIASARQKSSDLEVQLAGVSTDDALNAIVNQFNNEVDPLVTDSDQACRSLQTLANSDGINVDLSCGPLASP